MYNCDFEGVSRRKSEKKGKTVWPSSRPFSTWPHRKLANEISPRKAIGLQIFNSRSPNANCNEEKPLQSAAAGDRGKVESKRKEERRLSQSSSKRLLQTGLCSAPLFLQRFPDSTQRGCVVVLFVGGSKSTLGLAYISTPGKCKPGHQATQKERSPNEIRPERKMEKGFPRNESVLLFVH